MSYGKKFDITATTSFDSDVPIPYFSWELYAFMKPVTFPKNASAMAVVFISNCRETNSRLQIIRELMKHGITVHSYGLLIFNKS